MISIISMMLIPGGIIPVHSVLDIVLSTSEINFSTVNGPTLSVGDLFGTSVANIGDLDGDGVNDIVVGAGGDDEGGTSRGAVHIILLNTDGTPKSTVEINDNTTNGPTLSDSDEFGTSVANIGDLDGDGVNDIVVGASGTNITRGAIHIILLNADGTPKSTVGISDTTTNGPTLNDFDSFGKSVANIGDLDGDGVNDIVVGASGDDQGGSAIGTIHIIFLNTDGTPKSTVEINDNTTNGPTLSDSDEFGTSVVNIGDLDGDGVNDIVVGAPKDGEGGSDGDAVHIIFLGGIPEVTNNPPIFDFIQNQSVDEDASLDLLISATDADGDMISFGINPSLNFTSFVDNGNNTATFLANPSLSDSGIYNFNVTATDGIDYTWQIFTLTVNNIEDTTPPVLFVPADITAEATGTTTVISIGTANATDNVDPTPTITNDSPVSFPLGSTIVTYTATDASGNSASATQIITIQDTTPPVITLNGSSTVEVLFDDQYSDDGATALDNIDGDITIQIVTNNLVDTAIAGNYTVTYNVSDSAGNAALEVTRTVTVLTLDDSIIVIIAELDLLVGSGNIDGETTALMNKLDQILSKFNSGNTTPACNQLDAFVNQINSLVNNGTLIQAEAQPILDTAAQITLNYC